MDEDPLFSPNNNKKPPQQEVFDDDDDDDESDDYDNDDYNDDGNDDDSSENPAPCLMQSSFLVPKINLGNPNPGSPCKDSLGATIKFGLISTPGIPSSQKNQEIFYINKPLNPMAKEFRPASSRFCAKDYSVIASKPAVICPPAFKPPPPPVSADDKLLSHITEILKDNRLLILMRGCPGSGKSTLAKKILDCLEKDQQGLVLSTDNYFNQNSNHYHYDSTKLSTAHDWNKNQARIAMNTNTKMIIIDNTNVMKWEMTPYVKLAFQYNYKVEIVEPNTRWRFNAKKLLAHNIHGVCINKIKDMLSRYEKNVTVEQLVPDKNLQTENCHSNRDTENSQRIVKQRRKRRGDRNRHASNNKATSDNTSSPEMPKSEAFLANDKPVEYPLPVADDIDKDIPIFNIGQELSHSSSWGSDQWLEPQGQRTPKQEALNENAIDCYTSSSSDLFEEEDDILESMEDKSAIPQLSTLTLKWFESFDNKELILKASFAAIKGFQRKNSFLFENLERKIKAFKPENDGDDSSSSNCSSAESLKDSTSSTTDDPEDQNDFYVKFSLDYNFLNLLIQMFGPINNLTNNEKDHEGNINLKMNYDDLKHFHQALSNMYEFKKGIDNCQTTKNKKGQNPPSQNVVTSPPPPTAVSLTEIMKEQEESMIELEKKIERNDHASVMKLRKLISKFPGYDANVIQDIFKANDYNMHETLAILQGHPQHIGLDWRFDSNVAPAQPAPVKKPKKPNGQLRLNWLTTVNRDQFEVVQFYEERLKDSIRQRDLFSSGAFYGKIGFYRGMIDEFKTKLKTAKLNLLKQNIASSLTVDNYNQIDLHGMNRHEGAYIIRECLRDYTEAIENSSSMKPHLIFITGKGLNSIKNTPVLKPYIVSFLEKNKYRFTASEGTVKVFL